MSASDALVMVDETNPSHNVETGQIKFTKDSESIDVNGEQKLIGLTKEQLERYRNDPFWKPVRYTLFVLFWLIWIGMFVGAILIVVMSPKCAPKQEKKSSEYMVAYQIFTPTFRDSDGDGVGDLNGITEKLNELRRIGITTIWPTPLLTSYKDDFKIGEITDSLSVDPRFGNEKDLKALIEQTHHYHLYFIADLPLTISTDHPQSAKQGIGGSGKMRLLNLNVPDAWESLKKTASKLITLGVDGLSFAQYGLNYPAGSINIDKLENLAKAIKAENVGNFRHKADDFIFIYNSVASHSANSGNFHTQSLARFSNTQNVCMTSDFIGCLKESANTGANQIKKNASSLPIWQFGDVSHDRLDSLLGNVGNKSAQANFLATAIQLFLPGAVKIYYGEELGLPSVSQGVGPGPQFGIMPWESEIKGFTDSKEKLFFKAISEDQAKELNFKDQNNARHSHLKVFKKLADLRGRDEVFTDGDYKAEKIIGLHVFVRTLSGNDKAYILVVNWPASKDQDTKEFGLDSITKALNIKTASAELIVDHPTNRNNQWHIEKNSQLSLDPYEFVLVRVEVVP